MNLKRREFMPITLAMEGGRRRVHRIQCSIAGCKNHDDVSANTFSGSLWTEDLQKRWGRKGWRIGVKPSDDVCPICVAAEARMRRSRYQKAPKPMTAEIIDMATAQKPVQQQPAPLKTLASLGEATGLRPEDLTVEPPAAMARDDRRLIFQKLDEVYLDEKTGYSGDWTDARVATHLGVPRAWVAAVREENFGPEKSNEEVRAVLAEIKEVRAVLAEIKEVRANIEGLVQRGEQNRNEAQRLVEAMRAATARLDALDNRLGRIEKSIAA